MLYKMYLFMTRYLKKITNEQCYFQRIGLTISNYDKKINTQPYQTEIEANSY